MKKSTGKIIAEVGAGLAVAGATAAAGYYLYGSKDAKKHRTSAKKVVNSLKKDILVEANRLQKAGTKIAKKTAKKTVVRAKKEIAKRMK